MKPMQTNQQCNLNMQPMRQNQCEQVLYATNAWRAGETNAGRRAEGINAGERTDGRILERGLKFGNRKLSRIRSKTLTG